MRVYEHYDQYPMASWRWKNFSPREMASRGDAMLRINEEAMDKLQALRDMLDRPLIINSAYRSPSHNARVGGAPGSKHLKAEAYDISMANQEPAEFLLAAKAVGFTGFGFYKRNNFIHIDIGPARTWGKKWFEDVAYDLPVERPYVPESIEQDKSATGAVVAGGALLAPGAALVDALSGLSPVAQALVGFSFLLAVGAVAFILRDRIKDLAR